MSHTNSTANYNLPQFVTTDKPAWLTDINGAFSAIDTAIDAAKDVADAAQTEATNAGTTATNAATAAATADAKGAGAVASIADTFNATSTYAVGDLVMYNSLLYICTIAVSTPGAWTGSTNWSRKTVEGVIDDLSASDIFYNGGSVAGALDGQSVFSYEFSQGTDITTNDTAVQIITANTFTANKDGKILVDFDALCSASIKTGSLQLHIDAQNVKEVTFSSVGGYHKVIGHYTGTISKGTHTITLVVKGQDNNVTVTVPGFNHRGYSGIII